ncbi:hypothetical protein ABPG74_001722 [Tetrahymena malaccensis]
MAKQYILATLLFTGVVLSLGVYYVFTHQQAPSIPLDENGEKIKLGGIPWPFINCGTEFDPLQVTSIVFSGQPERGAPPNDAVISGSMMMHEEYSNVNVIVKLNNVQVFNNNLPCTGTYDPGDMFIFNYAFQVPGIAPGGPYSVYFRFMNKQNQATSCTQVDMDL